MAKLYFRYGVMGCGKTAQALMVCFNYEERGQHALLVKPASDQRDGEHIIKSRTGMARQCMYFHEVCALTAEKLRCYDCIIVDEAQFLQRNEVMFLASIADNYDVPVICYGLRTDFLGEMFPGSAALMAVADKIEEIKTVCWCGRKATHNARFDENGNVLHAGPQFELGGSERYVGLCRKHWGEGNVIKLRV